MNLKDTLGNEDWLRANEQAVKDMLPETWTHMHNAPLIGAPAHPHRADCYLVGTQTGEK